MSAAEAAEALAGRTSGWRLSDDGRSIRLSLRFADFDAAFAFMTRVAQEARRLDHHPDWRNAFDRVDILLSTHDVGGLTRLDFALATIIDAAASGAAIDSRSA